MHAQLIPIDGSSAITLTGDVTLVGRKRDLCDLIVDRSSVSKIHCILVKTDGLLFVRDLGSTNGTRVNGQRVTRGALLPGDLLAFASVKYRVHLGPDEGAATAHKDGTDALSVSPAELEKMAPGVNERESSSDVRLLRDSEID